MNYRNQTFQSVRPRLIIFHNDRLVASLYPQPTHHLTPLPPPPPPPPQPPKQEVQKTPDEINSDTTQLTEVPPKSSGRCWILLGIILILLLVGAVTVPFLIVNIFEETTTTTTTTTTTSATTTTTTTTSTSTTTTTSTSTTTTTSSSIIYTQSFTSGVTPSSQCTAWTTFISLLTASSYTSMTIQGSNNPTGITLTTPAYILGIANALQAGSTYGPVSSNGYSWAVGTCLGGLELTATGAMCYCNTGYTVRPCIGNSNWGAINAYTCGASTQTLIVIFQ